MKTNNTKLLLVSFVGLMITTLSGCGSSSTTVNDSNHNLTTTLIIEPAAVVPVINGNATKTGIYVRNTTDHVIDDIRYNITTSSQSNELQISTDACQKIPANSSCLLPITTPSLKVGDSGSTMVVATYNEMQSKQLINYRYFDSNDYAGVNFSENNQSVFGTNSYVTSYVFIGKEQSQTNVGFSISNNSLAIVGGLTNGKVNFSINQVVALEIKSNDIITSKIVNIVPSVLTSIMKLNKDFLASNNNQLQVTIIPTTQGNLLMSNIPVLSKSESTVTLTVMNNGNESTTALSIASNSNAIDITSSLSNPCSESLASGASCNYQVNLQESLTNGSALLTLNYNNGNTVTSTTQSIYYRNANGAPMVEVVPTLSNFSEQVSTNQNITFNIKNIGGASLTSTNVKIKTTLQNTALTIQNNSCGSLIGADNSCVIQVNIAASGRVDNGIIYLNLTGKSESVNYSFMSKPVSVSILDSTSPTVVSSIPQDSAVKVKGSTSIIVAFSESMTATSLNNTSIYLQRVSDNVVVPLTLQSVSQGNQIVTFTQTSGRLTDFSRYQIIINPSQIQDINGNVMSESTMQVIATFTTGDSTAPSMSGYTPTNGVTNQSRTPAITITFSESMNEAMLNSNNIQLKTESGFVVPNYTIEYESTTNMVTVNLNGRPLSDSTTYKLYANQVAITDTESNSWGSIESFLVTTFTVGDFIAPTLVSTIPVNGATNIGIESAISLTFSEAMDTSTLTSTNIKLQKVSDGSNVTLGSPSYSNSNKKVTFQPSSNLTNGINYRIVINPSAIKDASLNNNSLGVESSQTVSSFVTKSIPGDLVFVSENSYKGGAFGGVTGADNICQQSGVSKISGSTWKALLSSSVADANRNYYRYDSTQLGNKGVLIGLGKNLAPSSFNWVSATSSVLVNPISTTAGTFWVPWGITYASPNTLSDNAAGACTNYLVSFDAWSSSRSNEQGNYGNLASIAPYSAGAPNYSLYSNCDASLKLVCVQQ